MNPSWYQKGKHKVRFWLLRTLPTCKQTVEVISQSLERPLSLRERFTLKLHLYVCIWCLWYLEHLEIIRSTTRARATEAVEVDFAPGPALSAEVRERIKRQLSDGGN